MQISQQFCLIFSFEFRIHPDISTNEDCEIVYELVYSSQAAAEFLNVRLFHLDEDSIDVVKTKRGKKRLPNTLLIRDLVQFFIESELKEQLDNKQESTLIEIMVSAVLQCSTGEPPVGRGTSRKMVCKMMTYIKNDFIGMKFRINFLVFL